MKNIKVDHNTRASELRRNSSRLKIDKPMFSPRVANSSLGIASESQSGINGKITERRLKNFEQRTKSLIPPISSPTQLSGALAIDTRLQNMTPSLASHAPSMQERHSSAALARDDLLKQMQKNKMQGEILDKIHGMRLRAFDTRVQENKTKPHVPLVNDDVKQVMV